MLYFLGRSAHARLKNAENTFWISESRTRAGKDFYTTLTLKNIISKIVSIHSLYDKLFVWAKDILQLCASVFTTGQFILVMVCNLKSMAGLVLLINEKHRKNEIVLKEKAPPLNMPKNAFTNASNHVRVVFCFASFKSKEKFRTLDQWKKTVFWENAVYGVNE